jgi:hypothetical protein
MPWPFRARSRPHASFAVASYNLDAPIGDLRGMVEFSAEEYATMGKQFKGERSYNAQPVHFLGYSWQIMLQTVNGQISKIAPHMELTSKAEANRVATATLEFCTSLLGKPNKQETGLFIWDTTDGNVLLQTAENMEGLAINLFLTSRSVRAFESAAQPQSEGQFIPRLIERGAWHRPKEFAQMALAGAKTRARLIHLIEHTEAQINQHAIGYAEK